MVGATSPMASLRSPSRTRVVHLLGSPSSPYYEALSVNYARDCAAAFDELTVAEFDMQYAVVHFAEEGGPLWSFPPELSEASVASAPRLSNLAGVQKLCQLEGDVFVPHMFCFPGLTAYRGLFGVLGAAFLGSSAEAQALVSNKGRARLVMASAGVPVAEGEVLIKNLKETTSITAPCIVKPCSEANSIGITLVKTDEMLQAAIDTAFALDDEIVIERFIPPGREMRVGILEEEDGSLRVLPMFEYFMSNERPIRTPADKLATNEKGLPTGLAKGSRKCPADVEDALAARLGEAAKRAHVALGCQDYSIFDVRIDPDENFFFLESSLFCSFAPGSVIVTMSKATGEIEHQALLRTMLRRAAERSPRHAKLSAKVHTMKPKRAKISA